jgi:hypothetical protein
VIPSVLEVEVVLDPRTDRGDGRPDRLIAEDLVDASYLNVQNLPT